jgi:hypothetical protein
MVKPQKIATYIENREIDRDMKTLFDYVSRLEYTETSPDGSRTSRYAGEAILLKSGSNFYLEVATAAKSTVWRGILLSDTP